MPYVFISYSSQDRNVAETLCTGIENEGVRCWIAPRNVAPGQRYAEAILEGIDDCALFLIVFSEAANASPHVCNEIEDAGSKGKPLLLVRTDSADPRDNRFISLFLRSHQWFDASHGSIDSHVSRIVHDVRRLLHPAPVPVTNGSRARREPVTEPPLHPQERGRRSIGVEVGATKIRAYVVDLDSIDSAAATRDSYFEPTRAQTARGVLEQLKELLGRIIAERFAEEPPTGIGVAAPGQVDLRAGTLKFGPNLFGARNVPFKTYLSTAFPSVPIRIDNEVRCATRYELHLGFGNEFDSFTCIFIGHGVGSGTVVDRRILFGTNFCAGEVGHTKIAPTGPPCACGQIGCLEAFVKAQAIVSRAEAKAIDSQSRGIETVLATYPRPLSPEAVVEAIERGDQAATETASEVAGYLGLGIANYLNLVNPAAVVIGGGIMNGFFLHMIDELTESVHRNALAEVANTPIVQSAHSEDGIALGAGLLFYEHDYWPFDTHRRSHAAIEASAEH